MIRLDRCPPALRAQIEAEIRRQDAERAASPQFGVWRPPWPAGPPSEPDARTAATIAALAAPALPEPWKPVPLYRMPGRPRYSAKPTFCDAGHRHPSKVEARVCGELRTELLGTDLRLFLAPRLPLFAIAPSERGRPLYFTPDFAIVAPGGKMVRIVDAKSGRRRSPEWRRGKSAAEATYGLRVEEIER